MAVGEHRYLVYGLFDPRSGELRYVGQTVRDPDKRLDQHVYAARHSRRKEFRYRTAQWVRSLLSCGLRPAVSVLEETGSKADLDAAERRTIAISREVLGCDLTNHTAGGEGTVGYRPSPETRIRMSAAHRRRPWSEELRLAEEKEAAALYAQGLSCRDVGLRIGLTEASVSKVLKRAGILLRSPWGPSSRKRGHGFRLSLRDIFRAVRLYGQGDSYKKIAQKMGCSFCCVRTTLVRAGVVARSRGARPHLGEA